MEKILVDLRKMMIDPEATQENRALAASAASYLEELAHGDASPEEVIEAYGFDAWVTIGDGTLDDEEDRRAALKVIANVLQDFVVWRKAGG